MSYHAFAGTSTTGTVTTGAFVVFESLTDSEPIGTAYGFVSHKSVARSRNIGGILGIAAAAAKWAEKNDHTIIIYSTYPGVEKFATGIWKPNREWIHKYHKRMQKRQDHIAGFEDVDHLFHPGIALAEYWSKKAFEKYEIKYGSKRAA